MQAGPQQWLRPSISYRATHPRPQSSSGLHHTNIRRDSGSLSSAPKVLRCCCRYTDHVQNHPGWPARFWLLAPSQSSIYIWNRNNFNKISGPKWGKRYQQKEPSRLACSILASCPSQNSYMYISGTETIFN